MAEKALQTKTNGSGGMFSGGGMFSLGGLVCGVVLSAGAMSLIRPLSNVEERPVRTVAKPSAASVSTTKIGRQSSIEVREAAASLSYEELIAELRRLDRLPKHSITDLEIKSALTAVADEDVSSFIKKSKPDLSLMMRERVVYFLIERLMVVDGRNAMDVARDTEVLISTASYGEVETLVEQLFASWSREDSAEASRWLLENWDAVNEQDQRRMIPGEDNIAKRKLWPGMELHFSGAEDLARWLVGEIYRQQGVAEVDSFLSHFEEVVQLRIVKGLFIYPPLPNGSNLINIFYRDILGKNLEVILELADYLEGFPKDPRGLELRDVVWKRWLESSTMGRKSFRSKLPERLQTAFDQSQERLKLDR